MGPHDALFKHVFSVPENAAAALACVLPAAIASPIDWATLRPEPGSFVDAALAERFTDLLFSAEATGQQRAFLYFLYEHRSDGDPWLPLRLAGYIVRILDDARERAPGRAQVPIVVPVVVHHHARGWRGPRALDELYDAEPAVRQAVGEHTLALRFVLDDLGTVSAADIMARRAPPLVRVVLGILRDARTLDLGALIARWGPLMIETARTRGSEALTAVWRYLEKVMEIEEPSVLFAAARERGGIELEETVMGAFDRVEAEGQAKGEAKGRAETILRLLALKFGTCSDEVVDRVRGASIAELERFAERILTATRVDEVISTAE